MGSNRITKDLVRMARKHLIEKGEHPSEGKIFAFIGHGSEGTVHKFNTEILHEERAKVLKRTFDLPEGLADVFLSSVADRSDEITATLKSHLDEKERSLKAAIEQLEELREGKTELEGQVDTLQGASSELNEALIKGKTARESVENSLQSTISDFTEKSKDLTEVRDELIERNQHLQIELATHKEAANHNTKEITRLNTAVEQMQEELQEERRTAAVAIEKAELLTKTLEQRADEIKRFSELENSLIEQFAILQESLLSNKMAPKSSTSGRGKSTSKPQANA